MNSDVIEFVDIAAQRRRLGPRVEKAMARVLEHGRFVLGPEVNQLEERLQAYSGAAFCVTCANGTDAIELALAALNIGHGDAVIIPAFTYVATAGAIVRSGATPVFADVDSETFNLCPRSTEAAIAAAQAIGLHVRAIMPVDLFGQTADYAAFRQLANSYGLKIIADAAQSFGAEWQGQKAGVLADISVTSFYPSKPLGCYGDGGAVFTCDLEIANALRSLRHHGHSAATGEITQIGRNSRLDTLQAAILLEKLDIFDEEIIARNLAAERYSRQLSDIAMVPVIGHGHNSVWAQYTIKVTGARNEIAGDCRAAGVPIAIHYTSPLHLLGPYHHFPRASASLASAEALSRSVLSLPMHAYLGEDMQTRIVAILHRAIASYSQQANNALA